MKRYQLRQLFTLSEFNNLGKQIGTDYKAVAMNPNESTNYDETISFVMSAIYGYFYEDLVAYYGETKASVRGKLYHRLGLDLSIKLPYWFKKYGQIKKLLTTEDLSLLQTSKMTSTSSDDTQSAGGTLQKTATTPTGVSATSNPDEINIGIDDGDNSVETNGFADKYTNAQQKFANATRVKGSRSGEILREGSIDDLLKVLEKLPSSFADEVLKDMQKHFIFDYDGELNDLYDFTEGDFGMGIVIGKTRTNQPVEAVEGFEDEVLLSIEGNDIEPKDVNATGKITGDEIIENMSGYSYVEGTTAGYTTSPVYVGAVKTGNKLTLVVALTFTRNADAVDDEFSMGRITIPEDILAKILPFLSNVVDARDIIAFASDESKEIRCYITKPSTYLQFNADVYNRNITANKEYYIRYEATFLLSDSLVSE